MGKNSWSKTNKITTRLLIGIVTLLLPQEVFIISMDNIRVVLSKLTFLTDERVLIEEFVSAKATDMYTNLVRIKIVCFSLLWKRNFAEIHF